MSPAQVGADTESPSSQLLLAPSGTARACLPYVVKYRAVSWYLSCWCWPFCACSWLKRVASTLLSCQASAQLFKGDAAHLVDELIRCSQLKPAALPHLEGRELVPWTDDSVVPGAGFLPLENRWERLCTTLFFCKDLLCYQSTRLVCALARVRDLGSQGATSADVACWCKSEACTRSKRYTFQEVHVAGGRWPGWQQQQC